MRILITGGAGFIGAWVGNALLTRGDEVIAVDDFSTTIYDASLKEARASKLLQGARVERLDILNHEKMAVLLKELKPDCTLHFAAIAGIRYAQKDPLAVIRVNVDGTASVFEAARWADCRRIVYASSSSVYGRNKKIPFHEDDPVVTPVSHYASTKRAGELIAEVYRHAAGISSTGIRFFSAYGPWGRPDMAYFSFTRSLFDGTAVSLYAQGKAARDFTSIHDIVRGVLAVIDRPEVVCPFLNLGNAHPVTNGDLLARLEQLSGKKAQREELPLPAEDVPMTFADISRAKECYGWEPKVSMEDGLKEFVEWYRSYYGV